MWWGAPITHPEAGLAIHWQGGVYVVNPVR